MESSCLLPVDIFTTRFLTWPSSIAVINPEVDGYTMNSSQSASVVQRFCFRIFISEAEEQEEKVAYLALLDGFLDLFNLHFTETFDL